MIWLLRILAVLSMGAALVGGLILLDSLANPDRLSRRAGYVVGLALITPLIVMSILMHE